MVKFTRPDTGMSSRMFYQEAADTLRQNGFGNLAEQEAVKRSRRAIPEFRILSYRERSNPPVIRGERWTPY